MEIRVSSYLNSSAPNKSCVKRRYTTLYSKKTPSTEANNRIVFSKKETNKAELKNPCLSLMSTSKLNSLNEMAGKKGLLLYQNIERNKPSTNGSELVNRFHLKT